MHQGANASVNAASTGVATKPGGPMPLSVFGGVAVYLTFIGVIIFLSTRWARRRRQAADAAIVQALTESGAQPLNTGPDGGYDKGTLREFEFAGQRVIVQNYAVSRYYYRFNLSVAAPPLPAIIVIPENKVERFGKVIGLNREIQIGDPSFDDAAYVDTTEADTPVQQVFASPAVRNGVRGLLALGYKVQLSARGLEAFQMVTHGKPPELTHVRDAVALLGQLATALPRLDPTSFRGTIPILWAHTLGFAMLWMVPLVLAGFVDGLMHSPGARTLDVGNKGLIIGVGALTAWLVYILCLALWLRGRTYAFRMLIIASFLGLFGLPTSGVFFTAALNQELDRSAAEDHMVTVIRGSQYKGDCRLYVGAWTNTAAEVLLPVSCKRFSQMPKGTEILIRTHAGALGMPWVEPIP